MAWDYTEEYEKLLEILDKDIRPWRPIGLLPEDGTRVYIKCGLSTSGKTLYDVGQYEKFSEYWYSHYGEDGEWNTEFGNCMEIYGWKLAEVE